MAVRGRRRRALSCGACTMKGNLSYDAILSLCESEGFVQVLQTATMQWFEREPRKAARAATMVERALAEARRRRVLRR